MSVPSTISWKNKFWSYKSHKEREQWWSSPSHYCCFQLRGSWYGPAWRKEVATDVTRQMLPKLLFFNCIKMRKELPYYTSIGKSVAGAWTLGVIMWISQDQERIPLHRTCGLFHSLHGTESDNLRVNTIKLSRLRYTVHLSPGRKHSVKEMRTRQQGAHFRTTTRAEPSPKTVSG